MQTRSKAHVVFFMTQLQQLTRIGPLGCSGPVGSLRPKGHVDTTERNDTASQRVALSLSDAQAWVVRPLSCVPHLCHLPSSPPPQFAVLYSIGSVVSVLSTLFLMGPVKQCQRMFEEKRIFATITYVAAIAATLAVAFTTGSAILCFVMLIIQFLALIWWELRGSSGNCGSRA